MAWLAYKRVFVAVGCLEAFLSPAVLYVVFSAVIYSVVLCMVLHIR